MINACGCATPAGWVCKHRTNRLTKSNTIVYDVDVHISSIQLTARPTFHTSYNNKKKDTICLHESNVKVQFANVQFLFVFSLATSRLESVSRCALRHELEH